MAHKDTSRPIPEHWTLVIEDQKDGSSISFYTCPDTGQRFNTYEDLIRYVNYAKAAKLSIYSPDFRPLSPPRRRRKKKACEPVEEQIEVSLNSDDSTFNLPSITSLELVEVASPAASDQQSSSGQMKTKKQAANEGCDKPPITYARRKKKGATVTGQQAAGMSEQQQVNGARGTKGA